MTIVMNKMFSGDSSICVVSDHMTQGGLYAISMAAEICFPSQGPRNSTAALVWYGMVWYTRV